ncbi:MAG: hypothetical protein M1541_12280, partial [Acidobacteria bacterium]|nr:hypothetical protein [Acidobacteriota bacterium]
MFPNKDVPGRRLSARRTSEGFASNWRFASVLRGILTMLTMVLLAAPLMAQEQGGGEASLKLPDLNTATFLGGIGGHTLLMGGLVVCALGFLFGLSIFVRLRNMPVRLAKA